MRIAKKRKTKKKRLIGSKSNPMKSKWMATNTKLKKTDTVIKEKLFSANKNKMKIKTIKSQLGMKSSLSQEIQFYLKKPSFSTIK